MNVSTAAQPFAGALASRFFLIGQLPTYAAAMFLLTLVWAGAPGPELAFGHAWQTASSLGVGEIVLIGLAVTLVAVLVQPLQLVLVRLLEGGWPRWLGSGLCRDRQLHRKRVLEQRAQLRGEEPDQAEQHRAGVAATRLRRRFPLPDHLIRATGLGNALAAMEDDAGREYGWDAVVAWPRLYPVLGDKVRASVADRRDTMDAAARLSVTAAVTTVATVALLTRAGWWVLLAFVPATVAVIAYVGAVQAAVAYGEVVRVAFDLHRFDLLTALHVDLPADGAAERKIAEQFCDHWRQGMPLTVSYRHPDANGAAGRSTQRPE
jgi:hypothetical protein